jgi:hypothetical protein
VENRELDDRWSSLGYGLTYGPDAVAYYCHYLELPGFEQQQCSYGRGAIAFRHAQDARGSRDGWSPRRFPRDCWSTVGVCARARQALVLALLLVAS